MNSKYDIELICNLYKDGLGTTTIGHRVGAHATMVCHILRKCGIQMRKAKTYDWPVEELRNLYENQRLTLQQIADMYGYNQKMLNKKAKSWGFRMRRRGPKDGNEHPGWRGGKIIDKSGYVLVYAPDHQNASSGGYVREHRLVMEQKIGRVIEKHEVVHHIDNQRSNNHPDNLELFSSNAEHLAETLKGKCPNWTPEGRERILSVSRNKKRCGIPQSSRSGVRKSQ